MKRYAPPTWAVILVFALAGSASAAYRHHHRHSPVPAVVHQDPPPKNDILVNIKKTLAAANPIPVLEASAIVFIQNMLQTFDNPVMTRGPEEDARAYLEQTALPGFTMFLQGRKVALSCLNPNFALRLAGAVKEARDAGIPAGVMSACRPPALGVGGMADKSQSMHAFGLAVDMGGIGSPGSSTAKHWYEIAARHGIVKPYAAAWEWNHMQPTDIKVASQVPPMKKVLSQYGPTDLGKLWSIETAILLPLEKKPSVVFLTRAAPQQPKKMAVASQQPKKVAVVHHHPKQQIAKVENHPHTYDNSKQQQKHEPYVYSGREG